MSIEERLEVMAAHAPIVMASLPEPGARSKLAIMHALVRPLLAVLGYDLRDRASYQEALDGDAVDLVLHHAGAPVLLVELRVSGEALDSPSSALLRAHAEAPGSVALVTDGLRYQLQLGRDGQLVAVAGMVLDLLDFDRSVLAWLRKLARPSLDLEGVRALALGPGGPVAIAAALAELLDGPDPEFVELVLRNSR